MYALDWIQEILMEKNQICEFQKEMFQRPILLENRPNLPTSGFRTLIEKVFQHFHSVRVLQGRAWPRTFYYINEKKFKYLSLETENFNYTKSVLHSLGGIYTNRLNLLWDECKNCRIQEYYEVPGKIIQGTNFQ